MKYLSLFSGIGGFELGIEYAYENRRVSGDVQENIRLPGGQEAKYSSRDDSTQTERPDGLSLSSTRPSCIGFAEIDKYASAIYQSQFPDHAALGDITKIDAATLPDFDFLVGGFPCQAFSVAGKRLGFDDTRGTLFFEIARILKEKQPRLFLLENVKGLLSHDNGRTFNVIISTLDELGYDLQWQVLNSKNHGVPQNRERVFIIGHLRGAPRPQVFPFGATDGEDTQAREHDSGGEEIYVATRHLRRNGKLTGRVSGTLQASEIPHVKIIGGLQEHQKVHTDSLSPTLTQAVGVGGGQTPVVIQSIDTKQPGLPRVTDDVATLGANDYKEPKKVTDGFSIRRLTPTECERLQGFPDGWTEGISDSQRYKCLGNAVTVNVIRDIMTRLL